MNLVSTLKDLISIESETGNEKNILAYIEKFLLDNGFNGELLHSEGGIIAIPKKSRKKIALVGHVDTVPIVNNQKVNFGDDFIGGRGSVDMKGGIAIILHSLIESKNNIIGVFYTAEEGSYKDNGLNIIMPKIIEKFNLNFSIILEPTNNEIQLGCLGALNATLILKGKAAHSARPWVGDNPIYKLDNVIEYVKKNELKEINIEGLVFKQVMSITKVFSGIANNVIPEEVVLNINFRYSPEMDHLEASNYITELFNHFGVVEILNCSDGARPNLNNKFVKNFITKTNLPVEPKQAWTDVARFYSLGIPSINFGPGDPLLAHSTEEHLSKKQLLESYSLLSRFLEGN